MSGTSPEAKLQQLVDREAIRDLACRYAHHVWQKEGTAAALLFTEDGEMDTGQAPVLRGRTALLESYRRMLGDATFQPFVHNHVIALAGDEASGTCYLDLRATMEGRSMIGSGWYEDHYLVTRADVSGYRVAADGNYDGLNEVVRKTSN